MSVRLALLRAANAWRLGNPAPLDVLQTLLDAGLDVGRLERKHRP